MHSISLLNELIKCKKLTLVLKDKKLWIQNEIPAIKPERYFTLVAKKKFFLFGKKNEESSYKYYITESRVKISLHNKVLTKFPKKITVKDEFFVGDIKFVLKKGLSVNEKLPIIKVEDLVIAHNKKEIPVIKKLNFQIYKGDFVALMGPSGCGKSTLLQELAGENNLRSGKIKIANRPLQEYYHSEIKTKIGYVRQKDSFHPNLTVKEILFFTAKLRNIPSPFERIDKVLKQLSIFGKIDSIKLSGGEEKRLAIANELLDQPDILLLDEPTSPLDPEAVTEFLETVHSLAHAYNRAVIMVTHKPGDLKHADKVIFLSKNGYQIYAGDKDGFVPYINSKLEKKLNHNTLEENLLEIYKHASDPDFEKKFYNPGYPHAVTVASGNFNKQSYNFLTQLFWLTIRYLRVKFPKMLWPKNLVNAILIPPSAVGVLFFAFPNFNLTCIFLISLATLWFGVNNGSKEIVEELSIYQRERAFNIKIDAYLLSKIIVLIVISSIQILFLLAIVKVRFEIYRNGQFPNITIFDPLGFFSYLWLLSLASIVLGLLISTLYKKVDKVLMLVPLILIPQIILSGLVSKPDVAKKEAVSYLMLGRWGLEGLCRIQDSAAKSSTDTLEGGYVLKNSNSIVIESISKPPNDTPAYVLGNAINALGSYSNNLRRDETKAWTFFNSLRGNRIVLVIHILLMYFLCRLVLLLRDNIPIYSLVNRKFIYIGLITLGISLCLIAFWFCVYGKEKHTRQHFFTNKISDTGLQKNFLIRSGMNDSKREKRITRDTSKKSVQSYSKHHYK